MHRLLSIKMFKILSLIANMHRIASVPIVRLSLNYLCFKLHVIFIIRSHAIAIVREGSKE